MEVELLFDWIVRLLGWAITAFVALYSSMRRKGNVRIAAFYWWFLTVQAAAMAVLSGIKVHEGLESARVLCVVASLVFLSLLWARIKRPDPAPYRDDDGGTELQQPSKLN
jgi:hypothetical protein